MKATSKVLLACGLTALLAAGCNSQTAGNNQPAAVANNAQPTASQKFSDQTYYKSAYLISGPSLSADAQQALTGFNMSKTTLPNGDVQITLKALKSEYKDQQYELKSGQQLYFIEKFLGDDDQNENQDKNFGDDSAVVVDSQGNVVQPPMGWSQ